MKKTSKKKLNIGVIFGGRSAEHEVSIVSARSIYQALNRNKYRPILIGITKQGRWLTGPSEELLNGAVLKTDQSTVLVPDPTQRKLVTTGPSNRSATNRLRVLDVIFPIIHGTYGEDGTLQGLLELSGIPYVGSGVLGSAVGMDKVIQKQILQSIGIPVVEFLSIRKIDWSSKPGRILNEIKTRFRLPIFIKPANGGSSIGITKVRTFSQLKSAVNNGFLYDDKIIIEQGVNPAREFECAVLGNEAPVVSAVGEIHPSNDYYDYDAKYVDGRSNCSIPAKIPKRLSDQIRALARTAFIALNASGLARVDFLYDGKKIFLNEINTLPGFTSISMYPKLWADSGLSYSKLLDLLIKLAIKRSADRRRLRIEYTPKSNWHRKS